MKIGFYPDVVNENATRIVASTVVVLGLLTIGLPNWISLGILFYGFTARVLYGPKFEPFAYIVSQILVPKWKIPFKPTAGPPKRFAQLIGFLFVLTAGSLFFANQTFYFRLTLSILVFFASLEAFVGFCAGCFFFAILMKIGLIPEDVCEKCNNLNFNK